MITDVAVKETRRKGKGVFALRGFRRGEFIFRRRHGRVVAPSEVRSLSAKDRRHLCELDYETSAVLLPPGCYLNHSCDPNAMRSGVKVFAWRPIRRGDEITIDYQKARLSEPSSTGRAVARVLPAQRVRRRAVPVLLRKRDLLGLDRR